MGHSRRDSAMWWWSVTGAMMAGFAIAVTLLISFDALMSVNLALSLAWLVFILLGVPVYLLPFLMCFSLVRHVRLTSRYAGAAYGAVFHICAHCGVLYGLRIDPLVFPVILAPLLVGGLLGSWLPAALAKP